MHINLLLLSLRCFASENHSLACILACKYALLCSRSVEIKMVEQESICIRAMMMMMMRITMMMKLLLLRLKTIGG